MIATPHLHRTLVGIEDRKLQIVKLYFHEYSTVSHATLEVLLIGALDLYLI